MRQLLPVLAEIANMPGLFRYLGAMLGRPRTFQDDDIDQEHLIQDQSKRQLNTNPLGLQDPSTLIELAPIFHAK